MLNNTLNLCESDFDISSIFFQIIVLSKVNQRYPLLPKNHVFYVQFISELGSIIDTGYKSVGEYWFISNNYFVFFKASSF